MCARKIGQSHFSTSIFSFDTYQYKNLLYISNIIFMSKYLYGQNHFLFMVCFFFAVDCRTNLCLFSALNFVNTAIMKTTFFSFFSNSCNAPRALRTQFSVVLKNQNKSQRIVLRIKNSSFSINLLNLTARGGL